MIGQLTGKISSFGDRYLIINVGGVGYKVYTTAEHLSLPVDTDISVWTHLVVREDALDLYGFPTKPELDFFELLLTVSGIGPKSALGVLSLAGTETLRKAIASGNTDYLNKIGGIGKKSAQKIVLELKDKISKLGEFLPSPELTVHDDVLSALEALGYTIKEAREAVRKIPDGIGDTGEEIKLALKQLGK